MSVDVATNVDTAGGVLSSSVGEIVPIPWWQGGSPDAALPTLEVMVPAGGKTTVTFTAEPNTGVRTRQLDVWTFGGGSLVSWGCGFYVTECQLTLEWDDLVSTVVEERYTVFVLFEEEPPPEEDDPAPSEDGSTEGGKPTAYGLGEFTLEIDPEPVGLCTDHDPYEDVVNLIVMEFEGFGATVAFGVDGSTAPWAGTWDPETGALSFSGQKADGDGVTSATFLLTYTEETGTLDGTERWSWSSSDQLQVCSDGTSTVLGR